MKSRIIVWLAVVVFLAGSYVRAEENLIDQTEGWEFIVNNAVRTVMDYALKKEAYRFVILRPEAELIKQYAGKYKGRYLLKLVVQNNGGRHFAMMLPNFNVHTKASALDDERSDLWTVVVAKHNGKEF